jgi:hypothetical protein
VYSADLCVALQRAAGPFVDIDDDSIRVAGKVASNLHLDLGHLFVNLGLSGKVSCCIVEHNFKVIERTFFSGFDFLMYGFSLPEIEVTSWKKPNSLL